MRDQVFICYCKQDAKWLEALQTHLKPLLRQKPLVIWDETMIKPGKVWREEIKGAIDTAKVAVLTESFADAHNCVFLGTSVVSGLGIALITGTGRNTAFGDIAVRLASRAPETEFERGIKSFGMLIMGSEYDPTGKQR
ncbi:MAG TPA: TIR domain-containing protein [Ktedonobacteraceae bacterium]|nr:TIR domain-containing protein [Ktedonobacteraceae bacterium]